MSAFCALALSCLLAAAPQTPSSSLPVPASPGVAEQIFAFDLLVAAAQQSPQLPGAAEKRLADNGMHVAARPAGFSAHEADVFWQAAGRVSPAVQRRAQALFASTDVVTTEAHALMLSMVGPAPGFVTQPLLIGLEARQQKFAARAGELSELMAAAYAQAEGPALWRTLAPAAQRAQPSFAALQGYDERLRAAFAGQRSQAPHATVLVAPLMAKDTGATLMLGDASAVLLLGPTATLAERDTLALHEMLHPRIAALVREHPALAQAIAQTGCLRGAYNHAERSVSVSQVYDGWADYVAESWVRGLSHRLGRTPQERAGFPLAPALAALSARGVSADVLASRAAALLRDAQARLCRPGSRRR